MQTRAVERGQRELTIARRAMACEFSVVFPEAGTWMVAHGIAAMDEVERLESLLSVYREDSDFSRLNRLAASGRVRIHPDAYRLISLAFAISRSTGGAFDVMTGALVKAWGFYQGPRRVPHLTEHAAALTASGFENVVLDDRARSVTYLRPGLEINPGSIGKGYALDQAMRQACRRGRIGAALLQGGQSSALAKGAPPGNPTGWIVNIGNPCRANSAVGRVFLRDRAIATSGAANQYFVQGGRRYGHILDPRTGYPSHKLLSATALAPTAAEADALSTAFFVLGVDGAREFLRSRPDVGAVLIKPGENNKRALDIIQLGAVHMEVFQ